MAFSPLTLLILAFSALVSAQNSSPEDGGGPTNSQPAPTTPANNVNNAAGASGSSSGYNLSKGGVIAIIVVVVIVAAVGIGSAVLFYIAKKRQWEIRKTLKRVSRRVGSKVDLRQSARRQSRPRGAVRMQSPDKRANVDVEKGLGEKSRPKTDSKAKRQAMQIDDSQTKPAPERKFKTALPESWTVGSRK